MCQSRTGASAVVSPLMLPSFVLSNVPITPTDKIQMLGVPLGPESFTDEFVRDSLLGITEGVMSKLMDFEDTQAALFLLRLSFGIVRATHFMRTTPLSLWSKQAEQFDRKICHTIFSVLASSLSMKLMIKFLFQLRLEVLELGESWIMQRGHLPRVGSKLRLLLTSHGSNLTMRTAQQFTRLSEKLLPLLM